LAAKKKAKKVKKKGSKKMPMMGGTYS